MHCYQLLFCLAASLPFFFLSTVSAQSDAQDSPKIAVGEMAPDWSLKGTDDKTYKLSDFKGKKAVVVAWYPAALTGG